MADRDLQSTPEQSDVPGESVQQGSSLQERTAAFPHLPGVYLFRNTDRTILYVGKARDLKKRISSYFRTTGDSNVKTRVLLTRATDLEYVVTSTEKEALLLESSLIKKHRPRYNVMLRDDKTYPSLRIDPREPYPRLDMVRRYQRDGALYFGPYPSGNAVRENLRLLNQLFPLRLCKGKKLMVRERPCLNHSLRRCLGACAGKVSQEEYGRVVEELVLFLQGKNDLLERELRKRMEDAAAELEFERAAFYRDRIRTLRSMLEKQTVVSDKVVNQDVIGIYQQDDITEIAVLFVRRGVLVGQRSFDLSEVQGVLDELVTSFIQQYYGEGRYIPDEIVLPLDLESEEVLQEWLSEVKGKRVHIWPAKRGDRRQLLELARKNARERQASRRRRQEHDLALLQSLQRILKLPRLPHRMACLDISNIQGLHAVGGLVVFTGAQPDKDSYRHYRIEETTEPDDPAMMREVVCRLVRNDPEFFRGLDLLVLDGGKRMRSTWSRSSPLPRSARPILEKPDAECTRRSTFPAARTPSFSRGSPTSCIFFSVCATRPTDLPSRITRVFTGPILSVRCWIPSRASEPRGGGCSCSISPASMLSALRVPGPFNRSPACRGIWPKRLWRCWEACFLRKLRLPLSWKTSMLQLWIRIPPAGRYT